MARPSKPELFSSCSVISTCRPPVAGVPVLPFADIVPGDVVADILGALVHIDRIRRAEQLIQRRG
jgi:hypothetical protein